MSDNDSKVKVTVNAVDDGIGCLVVILLIFIASYLGHIADALRELVAKM